jgi:hypothetical protein
MFYTLLIAYALLVYGIFKFVVCGLDIFLSYDQRVQLAKQNSWFKKIMTLDTTTAGKTLSVVYIIFALITILRALDRLHYDIINENVMDILKHRLFIYMIYGLLGLFLLVLYYIVLYTNIGVNKDLKYSKRYKLMGVCGGLIFLTAVPIVYMIHKIFDHGIYVALKRYFSFSLLIIALVVLTVSVLIHYAYNIIHEGDNNEFERRKVSFHEILTLFIIPTTIV